MDTLTKDDRLLLLKFVCAFAWADLEIQSQERTFIAKLMTKLKIDEHERSLVDGWLKNPPRAEEVDPAQVPLKHRQVFLETMRGLIEADGTVDPDEAENFELLDQLLR